MDGHVLRLTAAGELAHQSLLLHERIQALFEAGGFPLALALLERLLQALYRAPNAADLTVRPPRNTVLSTRTFQLIQ